MMGTKVTIEILVKFQEAFDFSGGAFDIIFSAVGKLWKLSPILPEIPPQNEIKKALELVDYHNPT